MTVGGRLSGGAIAIIVRTDPVTTLPGVITGAAACYAAGIDLGGDLFDRQRGQTLEAQIGARRPRAYRPSSRRSC